MEKSASPDSARKVVTRSPKRNVGLVNCPWFQSHPIEHESRLEKHFVLRAMLSPIVRAILHQPFELPLGGKERYIPDFLLSLKNEQCAVVEVKRAERIKALKERLDRIAARLAEDGLAFFVVHQGQIEGQRRAERAELLRRYAMHSVERKKLDAAVQLVHSKPEGISIGLVMRRCQLSEHQVFHAIARRLIVLGPKLLLSHDDLVFPPSLEITDAPDQFGSWFGCAAWQPHP
jgi:hypothetical protein